MRALNYIVCTVLDFSPFAQDENLCYDRIMAILRLGFVPRFITDALALHDGFRMV
jgi:hypothetical protein